MEPASPPADSMPEPIQVNSRRQMLQNSLAGLTGMTLTMVVGILYTRFAYRRLGVDLYGLVPLASNITTYLTTVTISVAGIAGRDIATQIARGDTAKANLLFNTFFRVSLAMSAGLFTLCVAGSFLIPVVFRIPAGQERAAQTLFIAIATAFLLSVVAMAFDGAIWARNRLDVRSLIEIIALFIRNGTAVALLLWFPPALWPIGVAAILASLAAASCSVFVSRRLLPVLRLQRGLVDRSLLTSIWESGRWLFVTQLTTLLFINIDTLLVGFLFGTRTLAFYNPVVQWALIIRGLSGAAAGVLGPPLVSLHAQNDPARLTRAVVRCVRFMALGIGLPAALLAGFSEPLLSIWLGDAFRASAPLAWVILLPIAIEAAAGPLFLVVLAANRFRSTAIAGLACALLAVVLAVVFSEGLGWGPIGVAAGLAVASLVRNGAVAWKLVADRLQARWRNAFGRPAATQMAFCLVTAAAGRAISRGFQIRSLGGVILGGGALALCAAVVAWFLLLNAGDRDELTQIARRVVPGLSAPA